ncbi:MAG TPA: hypothetical protein VNK96_09930 [Fimbriimonadales bacterium]|nr:hypothetical protein [Fimbriimonadales bacterium]
MSAVKSDCPVARERLIPYLSGKLDGTPEGEEFEAHVSNCPICKVVASDRRKTLQALIAALDPAVENRSIGNERKKTKDKSAKMLLLAGVCALLLIGMSYVSGPVSAILGDKMATGDESVTLSSKENPPISQHAQENASLHEESKKSIATASSTNSPGGQQEIKESKKAQNVSKAKTSNDTPVQSVNRSSPKKQRSKAARSSPPMNRIEIFDESGKKIGVAITPQGR